MELPSASPTMPLNLWPVFPSCSFSGLQRHFSVSSGIYQSGTSGLLSSTRQEACFLLLGVKILLEKADWERSGDIL